MAQSQATAALLAVVKAAQSVEFYKRHGTHGDGKDDAARKDLQAAINQARKLMREDAL